MKFSFGEEVISLQRSDMYNVVWLPPKILEIDGIIDEREYFD
jgi:hypothetical protein